MLKTKLSRIFVKILQSYDQRTCRIKLYFSRRFCRTSSIFEKKEKSIFCFKPTLVHKEDLLHLLECGPAELVLRLGGGAGRQLVIVTRRWADLLRLRQLNTNTTFDFKIR